MNICLMFVKTVLSVKNVCVWLGWLGYDWPGHVVIGWKAVYVTATHRGCHTTKLVCGHHRVVMLHFRVSSHNPIPFLSWSDFFLELCQFSDQKIVLNTCQIWESCNHLNSITTVKTVFCVFMTLNVYTMWQGDAAEIDFACVSIRDVQQVINTVLIGSGLISSELQGQELHIRL